VWISHAKCLCTLLRVGFWDLTRNLLLCVYHNFSLLPKIVSFSVWNLILLNQFLGLSIWNLRKLSISGNDFLKFFTKSFLRNWFFYDFLLSNKMTAPEKFWVNIHHFEEIRHYVLLRKNNFTRTRYKLYKNFMIIT
jgi:hypothetical protein